jgi:hypothetical protein
MGRTSFLIAAWLVALVGHYVVLVALEFHWNLFDWLPRFDLASMGLVVALLTFLAGTWHLARVSQNRVTRIVSLVGCVALLGLGIYVFPAEPKLQGLFSRQLASPVWYRGGRLLVTSCPILFWAGALFRSRSHGLVSHREVSMPSNL